MSLSISLADRLAAHPKLEHRVSALLDIVESESGVLDRADDAEEAVIDNLRSMGNELLTDWSAYKEDQKFSEACLKHPEAKAQKNIYWFSTYGKIEVIERCPTVNQHRVRPFSNAAQVNCREYSRTIQRRIIDFSADLSFQCAAKKMHEHYGIEIPESSIRAITLEHARCMQKDSVISVQTCQERGGDAGQFAGEMDGSMIPVVLFDEDAEGDKRKTRKTEWQEAKLCQIYKLGSTDKRHQATMGGLDEAGDQWLSCAMSQGFNQQSSIHCVSDGAKWIVSQTKRVFGDQGSFLVDYYHLSDYFAEAAEECAGHKKESRVEWRHIQQNRMKSGNIDAVMAELDQYRNGKKGKTANKSEECHRYIRNRPGQFEYASAKAANLPIGSGEIESSNSSIVQMRLKIPGAWWKPANAGAMLCLRTLHSNGEWDQYWEHSG